MSVLDRLRDLSWSWTRIAAHYRVSEREVRRWHTSGELPERLPAPPWQLNWRRIIVINDMQYPFHDQGLFEVTTQIAADAECDMAIWAGDVLDFPQLGSYVHDPYRLDPADQDVENFHRDIWTPFYKATGIQNTDWVDGNHEERYERYLLKNGPAFRKGMPSLREFLRLPDTVRYLPYRKAAGTWVNPDLMVHHGWYARKHSSYTAKAQAEEMGGASVLTGHTHRCGVYMHSTPRGVVKAYEAGHMCDEGAVPKAKPGIQNWQKVAGTLLTVHKREPLFRVDFNEVLGGKYVVTATGEYQL